jgi:hypothetical protein
MPNVNFGQQVYLMKIPITVECFGEAVLELVKVFAAQGHSGFSAGMTLHLFQKVASFKLLGPLPNPTLTGEYIDHTDISGGHPTWQSTRLNSVFSMDNGKTWYDLDKKIPWWKRIFGVKLSYLTF